MSMLLWIAPLLPGVAAIRATVLPADTLSGSTLPDAGEKAERLLENSAVPPMQNSQHSLPEASRDWPFWRPSEPDVDCGVLADVVVAGRQVGDVLEVVCRNWRFGRFPVSTVEQAAELFGDVFEEGGIYQKITEALAFRNQSADFCWKPSVDRPVILPTAYICPALFTWAGAEIREDVQSQVDDAGNHVCRKSCEHLCGDWKVSKETESHCRCRTQHPVLMGTMGYRYSWYTAEKQVVAQPSGCDLLSEGKCYGRCPEGFVLPMIGGNMRKTCSGTCFLSSHPYSCGFGCAESAAACSGTIRQQISESLRSAAEVALVVTGNVHWVIVVEAIMSLSDFLFDVMVKLIRIVKQTASTFYEDARRVGFLVAFLEFVQQHRGDELRNEMLEAYSNAASLLSSLIEALWVEEPMAEAPKDDGPGRPTARSSVSSVVSVGIRMGKILVESGIGLLTDLFRVFKPWLRPTCSRPETTVTTTELLTTTSKLDCVTGIKGAVWRNHPGWSKRTCKCPAESFLVPDRPECLESLMKFAQHGQVKIRKFNPDDFAGLGCSCKTQS
eukprot:TRINITY_DN76947_c0_g1_i1.p1 TRINITY_DN76947_c0_g1~~TRINITY_DN76947_c0_g1_i1.p1  ORF type:complete len:555 (+),score=38.27 TRINITY_DN76947_c0_g1_i1:192-1856(+)